MLELVVTYGIPALFLLMLSNGVVSAPPSEVTIAFGGFLAAYGYLSVAEVLIAVVLGNVTGATILYCIGRKAGEERVIEFGKKFLFFSPRLSAAIFSRKNVQQVRILFIRAPILLLGALRCVPIVRSVVSLPAGAYKVQYPFFLFVTMMGCTMWACLWCAVGYFFYSLYTNSKFLQLGVLAIGLLLAYLILRSAVHRSLER